MTDLAQLIERLEAASEGSRELDAACIVAAQDIPAPRYGLKEGFKQECRLGNDDCSVEVWTVGLDYEERYARYPATPVTTSIDAIVALIERKLPGWFWGIGRRSDADDPAKPMWAEVASERWIKSETEKDEQFESDGVTAPLALCVVLLRALQAQQETSEDE